MAKLEYFVVSQSVAVDQQTNRTSIFNVLETISAPKFPVNMDEATATALWRREPGDDGKDFQVLVRVSGALVKPLESAANFRMEQSRHRIVVTILGLPIASPGDVKFELLLNGQHVAEHILTVIAEPQPVNQATN